MKKIRLKIFQSTKLPANKEDRSVFFDAKHHGKALPQNLQQLWEANFGNLISKVMRVVPSAFKIRKDNVWQIKEYTRLRLLFFPTA